MPKLEKETYKQRFSEFFGDSPDDSAIAFMEDLSETLEELFAGGGTSSDKKYTEAEYKELDAKWRKKYTERFYSSVNPEKDKETEREEKDEAEKERLQNIKIDDLFETKS